MKVLQVFLSLVLWTGSLSSNEIKHTPPIENDCANPIIPVVDLADFVSKNATAHSRRDVAITWNRALEDFGFAVIKGHGISKNLTNELYNEALSFFNLPLEVKMQSNRDSSYGSTGGFTPQGIESVSRSSQSSVEIPPDLVESLIYRGEMDNSRRIPSVHKYWVQLIDLVRTIHRLSAEALSLNSPDFFEPFYPEDASYSLRLAHYPPVNAQQAIEGQMRYGPHTDYQGFTILRQDPFQPGLEILYPDEKWRPFMSLESPDEDMFVVNIGDLFSQWTNDRWKATMHRVSTPAPHMPASSTSRLSMVFFTGPHDTALIEPLPCCVDEDHPSLYAPILAGDHLRAKIQASNV